MKTTAQVLKEIDDNGGIDLQSTKYWTKKQLESYIYSNYDCNKYTAKKIAQLLS